MLTNLVRFFTGFRVLMYKAEIKLFKTFLRSMLQKAEDMVCLK